jgi:hypothetical protein
MRPMTGIWSLRRMILVLACGLVGLGACRPARRPAADASGAASACDEYYQKMMRCLESDRWPEQTRRETRASIERIRKTEQAATPIPEVLEMREDGCRATTRIMQQGNQWICPGVW